MHYFVNSTNTDRISLIFISISYGILVYIFYRDTPHIDMLFNQK